MRSSGDIIADRKTNTNTHTHTHTHTQADTLVTILRAPLSGGGVIIVTDDLTERRAA